MICGCTSTKAYFADRGNDALDMVTITGGLGGIGGVQGRAGPVQLGLFLNSSETGLRGGELGKCRSATGNILFFMLEDFVPAGDLLDSREKGYDAIGLPLFSWRTGPGGNLNMPAGYEAKDTFRGLFHPYYTQVEVAGGFIVTGRVGVNAGEILDFLLGWACIDIFCDDMSAIKESMKGATIKIEIEPVEKKDSTPKETPK